MTDPQDCPVGVSVYRGNANDQKTLAAPIAELKQEYGLRDVIMAEQVFDKNQAVTRYRGLLAHPLDALHRTSL